MTCHFLCALWSSVQPGLHEQDKVCLLRKRMRERPRMRLRRSIFRFPPFYSVRSREKYGWLARLRSYSLRALKLYMSLNVGPIVRYINSGRSA